MVLSSATRGFFWSRAAFTSSEKLSVDKVDRGRWAVKEDEEDRVARPTKDVTDALRRGLDAMRNIERKRDREREGCGRVKARRLVRSNEVRGGVKRKTKRMKAVPVRKKESVTFAPVAQHHASIGFLVHTHN